MSSHPNRSRERGPGANPTPAEVRAAREAAGLSQTAAGALVYSSLRAWQAWELGERRMHPAIWELWRIKLISSSGGPIRPQPQFRVASEGRA